MDSLRIVLAVLVLAVSLNARGQAAVFSFVDASGVLHLSNIDEDRRLQAGVATPAGRRGATGERPVPGPRSADGSAFDELIAQVAVRQGIDAALLHAVIAVESAYEPMAVSRRGASGLMQLMPETAKRYGVADVFDPADNVRVGAQYLNDLLKRFDGDLSLTLAAYNAGEGAVLKYGKRVPPFRETIAYVNKVVAVYARRRPRM